MCVQSGSRDPLTGGRVAAIVRKMIELGVCGSPAVLGVAFLVAFGVALVPGAVPARGAENPAGQDGEAPAATVAEALRRGEVTLAFRYRFENVEEDAFAKPAHASTLRTVLGYRTAPVRGWSLYLEAENVTELGLEDQFNNLGAGSLDNGVRDRPAIADPEGTEVQQAYLRFEVGETRFDLGRQERGLGDLRFLGPVGFRQNHVALDALMIVDRSLPRTAISYLFVDNVNRLFGDDKPMASHLLDVEFETSIGTATVSGYRLDYDRLADAGLDTLTWGLELAGKRELGTWALLYEGDYGEQRDTADNPGRVDAGYRHIMLGAARGAVSIQAGIEVLQGRRGAGAYQTPLATLHAYNGWADKFLVTPPDGLEDRYLKLAGKAGEHWSWAARYHDFDAESVATDYGRELDLQLTVELRWGQTVGLAASFYDARSFSTDTEKLWLWTTWSL